MRSAADAGRSSAPGGAVGWRGIARKPGPFVEKAWRNLQHLVRLGRPPVSWLRIEEPHARLASRGAHPARRHSSCSPVVALFARVPDRGPAVAGARSLIATWTGYYLLMVVVVFHNEIRYRSTLLPFALAGAAGGLALLADPSARRAMARPRRRGRRRGAARWAWSRPTSLPGVFAARARPSALALRCRRSPAATSRSADGIAGRAARRRIRLPRGRGCVPGRPSRVVANPHAALDAYERAAERKPYVWTPHRRAARACSPRPDGRRRSRRRSPRRTRSRGTSIPGSRSRRRGASCPRRVTDEVRLAARRLRRGPRVLATRWRERPLDDATAPGCGAPDDGGRRPTRSRSDMGSPAPSPPRGARGPRHDADGQESRLTLVARGRSRSGSRGGARRRRRRDRADRRADLEPPARAGGAGRPVDRVAVTPCPVSPP